MIYLRVLLRFPNFVSQMLPKYIWKCDHFNILVKFKWVHCQSCVRTLCAEHSSYQMVRAVHIYIQENTHIHIFQHWWTRRFIHHPFLILTPIFRHCLNLVFIHVSEFALIVLTTLLGKYFLLQFVWYIPAIYWLLIMKTISECQKHNSGIIYTHALV